MVKRKRNLNFHLITSRTFWVGAPMIISEIIKRGHYLSVFDENSLPPSKVLLDCDVFIDMSTITRKSFYLSLSKEYMHRKSSGLKGPLMIDPPEAIINSFDKQMTHKMFPDLVPESYVLTGKNNKGKIEKFKDNQFVVIKPTQGWWGQGVERLTPQQAFKKHTKTKNVILQKYVPPVNGIGRIVTICHKNNFEIATSYIRVSSSWRTGTDVNYKCVKQPVTKELQTFASVVSKRCGLYLNGIDYIYNDGNYVLLEVNAVPAMKEPLDAFGINIPKKLLAHIEHNVS